MINPNEIYVTDACLADMAADYPRIGKGTVAFLIATGREVTPAEAATVGVKLGSKDRGFFFKEYAGVIAVTTSTELGKHPFRAVAFHPLPPGEKIPAMSRFPFPVRK